MSFRIETTTKWPIVIPDVTETSDGLMTAADKIKLDGLSPGGGGGFNVVEVAGNYGASYGDLVVVDSTTGTFHVNLPFAADATSSQNAVVVKNDGVGHPVGVNIHVGDSADVQRTLWPGDFVYFVSDGVSRWIAISTRFASEGASLTALQTSDYSAVPGDFVQCDPTGGAFNVTLPLASTAGLGAVIEVKNKANTANAVTVLFSGGDSSDGQSSIDIASYESIRFVSDGISDWMQAA